MADKSFYNKSEVDAIIKSTKEELKKKINDQVKFEGKSGIEDNNLNFKIVDMKK